MRATAIAWTVVHVAAGLASATQIPLTFYSSSDCQTLSTITPTAQGNVSECVVTPGMVSVHFGFVGCAGGGNVHPYFFQDTACNSPIPIINGPFSTGDDGRCFTVYHTTVAAMMLSCSTDDSNLETPTATDTISVAPVATGAPPAASTSTAGTQSSASSSGDGGNNIVNTWNTLSSGAHIGIIVGAAVLVVALLYCCIVGWRKRRAAERQPPPLHDYPVPYWRGEAPWKAPGTTTREILSPSSIPPYSQVLYNVVLAAGYHAASGIFDTDLANCGTGNPEGPLPPNIISSAFADTDEEMKHKMGAAGELYMFEYLSRLNLPNFGRQNWPSDIRGYVRAHPKYQDMQDFVAPSPERAITDIEYEDVQGAFTHFLIERQYLPEEARRSTLKYHLEVKATTSTNWDQPFYISRHQLSNIEDDLLSEGRVYIICRVYGLGQGRNTHLRIYFNPRESIAQGKLEVEPVIGDANRWKVTPKM